MQTIKLVSKRVIKAKIVAGKKVGKIPPKIELYGILEIL